MTSVNMQRCVQAGCDMAGAAISSAIILQCTCPEKRLFVHAGGIIEVESEVDHGTAFVMYFPQTQ